ncbi:SURF1 family protein [Janibacter sp. G1551]|uniref:SURF1 family protein n=1 Tax=Janibacter sp. G1551 TaxID=3420440 RepID=UPI003D000C58
MLRTVLRPRWLGLLVLAIALAGIGLVLGRWQLGVAADEGRQEAIDAAAARPVVAVSEVLTPHGDFPDDASGRRVSARGTYVAEDQVLIPGRLLGGREGLWVLTPLHVEGGALLPVVRGWVPADAAQTPPAPPTGTVDVAGSLAPGESPADPADLPPGQLGSIDLSVLVNTWEGELYNAFAFALDEQGPAGAVATTDLTRVPPPEVPSELQWQNLAYALQWWAFGLFALWMWWRMVRAETEALRALERDGPDGDDAEHPDTEHLDTDPDEEPHD